MVKKIFALSSFIVASLVVLILFGVTVFILSGIPHAYLKRIVSDQLQGAFAYPVHFTEISGNLLTQAVVHDFVIENPDGPEGITEVVKAPRVVISYNLFNLLFGNNLINRKSLAVTIREPVVTILHYPDDSFNILKMVHVQENQPQESAPFPFQIRIKVNKAQITYLDYRGFGAQPLDKPVKTETRGVDSEVRFDGKKLTFGAKGDIKDLIWHNPFTADGSIQMDKGTFRIDVKAVNLSIMKWGNYMLSIPDFRFADGYGNVSLHLKNAREKHANGMPFDITVTVDAKEVSLTTPWIKPYIEKASGSVTITNNAVTFGEIVGRAGGNTFSFTGRIIDFARPQLNLAVHAPLFDTARAAEFYPFLKGWELQGTGNLGVRVSSGQDGTPVVTGTFVLPQGSVMTHPISELVSAFSLQDRQLGFQVSRGKFYEGDMKVKTVVDLSHSEPVIRGKGSIGRMDAGRLFKGSPVVQGWSDVSFTIDGVPENLKIETDVVPRERLFIAGQPVDRVKIKTVRDGSVLDFQSVAIDTAYGDVVRGKGKYYPTKDFEAVVEMDSVFADNTHISAGLLASENIGTIAGKVGGSVSVSGRMTPSFASDPLQYVRLGGAVHVEDMRVRDQAVDSLETSLAVTKSTIVLPDLAIRDDEGSLEGQLSFDAKGLLSGDLKADNLDVRLLTGFISSVPEPFRKLEGLLHGGLKVSRRSSADISPGSSAPAALASLQAEGTCTLSKARFMEQPVSTFNMQFAWNGSSLIADRIVLQEGSSSVTGSGFISAEKQFSVDFEADRFLLDEFGSLTHRFGRIGGEGTFRGKVYGKLPSWNIDLDYNVSNARYNSIVLDRVSGFLIKEEGQLSFAPLLVSNAGDQYALNGCLQTGGALIYVMSLSVEQGSVQNILDLLTRMRTEYRRNGENGDVRSVTSQTPALDQLFSIGENIDFNEVVTLYNSTTQQDTVVDSFRAEKDKLESVRDEERGLLKSFSGTLTGKVSLDNRAGFIDVEGDVDIRKGHVGGILFDTLKLGIVTSEKKRNIHLAILKGLFAEASFDSIQGEFIFDENQVLAIRKFALAGPGQQPEQVLSGTVPLGQFFGSQRNDQIDVDILLEQDNLNLLSLFNKNIVSMKNKGSVSLHLGGTLKKPLLTGKHIIIRDAEIKLSEELYLTSALQVPTAQVELKNNIFSIKNMEILWQGKDTFKEENVIRGRGTITLSRVNFLKPDEVVLVFDLGFDDTRLKVNFPQLYMGTLDLQKMTFRGPLSIPLSEQAKERQRMSIMQETESGPLLSGRLLLAEAEIPLPESAKRTQKPSILFDMSAFVGKNVIVTGGNFSRGALPSLINDIEIELEEKSEPLLIKGSLNTIVMQGYLDFRGGEIAFFNRRFTLLSAQEQDQYFRAVGQQTLTNRVEFRMVTDEEDKRRRLKPYFSLAAMTEVQPLEIQPSADAGIRPGSAVTERDFIFVLNGPISDPDAMYIYQFTQTGTGYSLADGYPYVMGKLTYAQVQELTDYLLPEILKVKLYEELFKEGLEGQRTRQVLRDISEKQINALFSRQLRPIERDIAEKVGLYDIRFNYNLGKSLNEAILSDSKQENNGDDEEDEKLFGVDLAWKLFFNRLFVRVRTQVDRASSEQKLSLHVAEYELSYAIFEWLSVNYHTMTFRTENDLRGVFSLEAKHSF